jgi:hypothetical protein
VKTIVRAVAIACALAGTASFAIGQTGNRTSTTTAANYTPPRTADGQPDLQGIWQVRNTANSDIQAHGAAYRIPAGFGVVEGNEIPYQPWALAKKQENFKNRLTEDPLEKCYLAGTPRTMYLPYPFQILQTPEAVVIVSSYVHTWRWIPTVSVPRYDGYESWMGDPRGRWEGNTLVVETTNFTERSAFRGASEHLKMTERFTPVAPNVVDWRVTFDDPHTWTRPWTFAMVLKRATGGQQVYEYACHEGNYGLKNILTGARADDAVKK